MLLSNISRWNNTNITFAIQIGINSATSILELNSKKIQFDSLKTDRNVAKLSVIGMEMMSQSGVAQMF